MKNELRSAIADTLQRRAGLEPAALPDYVVEEPNQPDHGDFATNAAMVLARFLKKAPRDIAAMLAEDLQRLAFIERVEVAGPGFVNFFVRADAWRRVLVEVLDQGAAYGCRRAERPENILLEFVSANPTGPLHFGHGRGAVVGDVLARLLRATGHRVTCEFYVNDAGRQVQALALSVVHRLREQQGQAGSFPEDGYRGDYVRELAVDLPEHLKGFLPGEPTAEQLDAIREHAVERMLAAIRGDLEEFGVAMDVFTSEREVVESGRVAETFDALRQREVYQEREGAAWFLSDRFGDEKPRVLVKSDGSHTYFATDVAYHLDKLRRGYQRLVNIWGADHHGYVPRMKAALDALGHPPEALEIVLVQMVSLLRDGQPVIMSKREGEITTLHEVVEEVGRDAARFFFLLRGTDSQMEFDLELAKRRSMDNPVFYVQYGHARLTSILARATERGIAVPDPGRADEVALGRLELPEELSLTRRMAAFPEAVERAARNRAPHLLVFYLQELVADFHRYYTAYSKTSPILGGDPDLVRARLILVLALRQVLRNALGLLGVSAPDRMESPATEEQG